MAVPYSLLNPFFEELTVRAYLMSEVQDLTGSMNLAAFLSVVVQFSYHLYYGWTGAIALSFQFLIFGDLLRLHTSSNPHYHCPRIR